MNCPYCTSKFKFLSKEAGSIPDREIPLVCEGCAEVSMYNGIRRTIRRANHDDLLRLQNSPVWERIRRAQTTFTIQRKVAVG